MLWENGEFLAASSVSQGWGKINTFSPKIWGILEREKLRKKTLGEKDFPPPLYIHSHFRQLTLDKSLSFRQLSIDNYQLANFEQLTLDNSLSFNQLSIDNYQLSNFEQLT